MRKGSVEGIVAVEGQGLGDIKVVKQSKRLDSTPHPRKVTTFTASDGSYRFTDVEPGPYNIAIDVRPADKFDFDAIREGAEVIADEIVKVNFAGNLRQGV